MGCYREDRLFLEMHNNKTKGNRHQLQQGKSQLDLRKKKSEWWKESRTGSGSLESLETLILGDIQVLTGQGPKQPALFLETVLLNLGIGLDTSKVS